MIQRRKQITPEQALIRLEATCAASEQSSGEALEKMRKWGLTPAQAQSVLKSLINRRFIDDARFARAYVRDKVRFERRGRLYLRIRLKQKGINDNDIELALDEIDPELYSENLRLTLQRRIEQKDIDLADYPQRMSLLRYAVSRGYEPSPAAEAIRELASEQ